MRNIILLFTFIVVGSSFGPAQRPVDEKKVALYREIGISNYWELNFSLSVSKLSYVLKYKKDDHEAYYYRGLARGNQGAFSAGISDFNKAINLYQGNPDYYYKRAQAYFKLRRYEKAVFAFDEAISKAQEMNETNNLPIMYYEKALSLVELKNLPGACRAFTEANSLGLEDAKKLMKKACRL